MMATYLQTIAKNLDADCDKVVNVMIGHANAGKTSFLRTLYSTDEDIADKVDFHNKGRTYVRGKNHMELGHETQEIRVYEIPPYESDEVKLLGEHNEENEVKLRWIDIYGFVDSTGGTFQKNEYIEVLEGRRKHLEPKLTVNGFVPNASEQINGKLIVDSVIFVISALEISDGIRLPVLKKKFMEIAIHERKLKGFLIVTKIDEYLKNHKVKLLHMDSEKEIEKVVYMSDPMDKLKEQINDQLKQHPSIKDDVNIGFMVNYSDLSGDFTTLPCVKYLAKKFVKMYSRVMKRHFQKQDGNNPNYPGYPRWRKALRPMKELAHCWQDEEEIEFDQLENVGFYEESDEIPKSMNDVPITEVCFFKKVKLYKDPYRFAVIKNFKEYLITCFSILDPKKGFITQHSAPNLLQDIINSFKQRPGFIFFEEKRGGKFNTNDDDDENIPYNEKFTKRTQGLIIKGKITLYLTKCDYLVDFYGNVEGIIQIIKKYEKIQKDVTKNETGLDSIRKTMFENQGNYKESSKVISNYMTGINVLHTVGINIEAPEGKERVLNVLYLSPREDVYISTKDEENSYIMIDLKHEYYLHLMVLTFKVLPENRNYTLCVEGSGNRRDWEDVLGGEKDVSGEQCFRFDDIAPCRYLRLSGAHIDQDANVKRQIHIISLNKILCKQEKLK